MAPKKKTTDTPKEKSKELFDFINIIYQDQRMETFDGLTEIEKKKYKGSRYMIHRFLSMNPMYASIVNAVQKYPTMPDRAHYMFLTNMIPKGRQFNKYIKSTAETIYEQWLIDLVARHYQISLKEATSYLGIYYHTDVAALKDLCEKYGIDKKQLKTAKLV